MAQDSWPSPNHNSRNVTDAEYEKIAARFSDDGVWGDPNDNSVVYTTAGLQVFVRAAKFASVRGHAWTSGTTDVTLTIGANSSGSTRTDRVVLRLDRSTWDVRAVVKAGTPGAGAPALTRDTGDTGMWEIPLARVTVPNGAASVTVTREELYVGSRVRPATSTTANPNPALGEIQFEKDTNRWRGWNGTSRVPLYEDTGEIPLDPGFSTWEVHSDTFGRRVNGTVFLRFGVRRVTNTLQSSDPDGSKIAVVPGDLRPANRYHWATGRFTYPGGLCRVEVRPGTGEVWVRHLTADVDVGKILELTMSYPQ